MSKLIFLERLDFKPNPIKKGDTNVSCSFDARNYADGMVRFVFRVDPENTNIFLIDDNNNPVKELEVNKAIGNRWKNHKVRIKVRVLTKPSQPQLAGIQMVGFNTAGWNSRCNKHIMYY